MNFHRVGTETMTRTASALLTRLRRKPPTWLVECVNDEEGTTYQTYLVKNRKGTEKRRLWAILVQDGPKKSKEFGSRRAALRYAIGLQLKAKEPEGVEI